MATESVKLTFIRVTTDDLLSIGRAAKVLNVSRRTLYNWVEDNKLVTITLGGILFVPKSEIERLQKEKAAAGKL
jgi:excisionase family DNA binding protein